MMVSNRRYEIWEEKEKRFSQHSGDAWDIVTKLSDKYFISISKSTLYRMRVGQKKKMNKGHEANSIFIICIY